MNRHFRVLEKQKLLNREHTSLTDETDEHFIFPNNQNDLRVGLARNHFEANCSRSEGSLVLLGNNITLTIRQSAKRGRQHFLWYSSDFTTPVPHLAGEHEHAGAGVHRDVVGEEAVLDVDALEGPNKRQTPLVLVKPAAEEGTRHHQCRHNFSKPWKFCSHDSTKRWWLKRQ